MVSFRCFFQISTRNTTHTHTQKSRNNSTFFHRRGSTDLEKLLRKSALLVAWSGILEVCRGVGRTVCLLQEAVVPILRTFNFPLDWLGWVLWTLRAIFCIPKGLGVNSKSKLIHNHQSLRPPRAPSRRQSNAWGPGPCPVQPGPAHSRPPASERPARAARSHRSWLEQRWLRRPKMPAERHKLVLVSVCVRVRACVLVCVRVSVCMCVCIDPC